eukprot:17971-Heterococcus_DN1.PRE.1
MDLAADRPEKKRRISESPDSAGTSDQTAQAPTHGGTVEQALRTVCAHAAADHQQLIKRTAALDVASDRPDKKRRTSDHTAAGDTPLAQFAQLEDDVSVTVERAGTQRGSQPVKAQPAMRKATAKEVSTDMHSTQYLLIMYCCTCNSANAAVQLLASESKLVELQVTITIHTLQYATAADEVNAHAARQQSSSPLLHTHTRIAWTGKAVMAGNGVSTNGPPRLTTGIYCSVLAVRQHVIVPGTDANELLLIWKWHANDCSTYKVSACINYINLAARAVLLHTSLQQDVKWLSDAIQIKEPGDPNRYVISKKAKYASIDELTQLWIGGMQRYLDMLLKDAHYTTQSGKEVRDCHSGVPHNFCHSESQCTTLELDMDFVYEMQGERVPMFLRKHNVSGQFAVVFNVVRLDETVWKGKALFEVLYNGYRLKKSGVHFGSIQALVSCVQAERMLGRMRADTAA